MDNIAVGSTVEILEGIWGGHFGDYYAGDLGEVLRVDYDTLKVDFGGNKNWYNVLISEVRLVPTMSPVLRRIKTLHLRQKKHPFLSKEYVING